MLVCNNIILQQKYYRIKTKAKHCEAVPNQPKDVDRNGDEAAIGDEATMDDNDGIHNMR